MSIVFERYIVNVRISTRIKIRISWKNLQEVVDFFERRKQLVTDEMEKKEIEWTIKILERSIYAGATLEGVTSFQEGLKISLAFNALDDVLKFTKQNNS